jgi:hypothetical protein
MVEGRGRALSMIGVFRGCRIAANTVAAVVIVLMLVDPKRDLKPIYLLLPVAVALWLAPVVWRRIR